MTYDELRHLADSWGLIFMGAVFLVCVAWAFRPSAGKDYREAAQSILENDDG